MSHTNSTTNYALPQFLTTDKPAWLTDINNAFLAIDTAIHNAQSDATTAGNNATQALSDASAASTAAATADAKGSGACASIEATFDPTTVYAVGAKVMYNSLLYRCNVAVITPGPWTGSANWERITVNSLIPANAGDIDLTSDPADGTVQAAISDLNTELGSVSTVTINGSYATGNMYYRKIGRLVIVFGLLQITTTAPVNSVLFSGVPVNNNGANNVIKMINNDGLSPDVVVYCGNNNTNYLSAAAINTGSYTLSFSYYTND